MDRHTTPSPRRTAVAIAVMFFVNGATFGSWAPRLPEIRERLDVSDTVLGLTLVGSGLGGLVVSLVSGVIVDRFGSRAVTLSTSLALLVIMPFVSVMPLPALFFVLLLAIGGLDGLTDVAQNTQAIDLQRGLRRSILNRMHATWSIGTLASGVVTAWLATTWVTLTWQLSVTSALLAAMVIVAAPSLLRPARRAPEVIVSSPVGPGAALDATQLDGDAETPRTPDRPPRRLLAGLFGIGVLAVLVELPPTEWAALLMEERHGLSVGAAGLGFVGFAAGMVLGRLSGDLLVDRFDPERVRRASAGVAGVGLLIATTGPTPLVSIVGFAIAGSGAAAMFPLAVRRAGDLVPGATGVAMFASGSRLGILLGPLLMGNLSDATSRSMALGIIGVVAAVLLVVARLPEPASATAATAGATPPG